VIVVHSISLIIKSEKTPEEISPERNWAKWQKELKKKKPNFWMWLLRNT
jgi:hypothetical protein